MERRYLVLLVEDEPLVQMLIVDVLEGRGVCVSDIASSAADALKMIERGGFDAAILDCVLKDGRCEPVAAALEAKGVPYVIVSGHSEDEVGRRFPGVPYVAKPFYADELEAALLALLPAEGREDASNDNAEAELSRNG